MLISIGIFNSLSDNINIFLISENGAYVSFVLSDSSHLLFVMPNNFLESQACIR